LTAAQNAAIDRVVHVSSVSTIGGAAGPDQLLTENDFGKGLGTDLPYPNSKLRGERVALEFAAAGLPVVIASPTFFAGPGDVNLSSARTIVSFLRRQVWVGLTRGGIGYTDVRDVAAGLRAAMERGLPGRRYILGGVNLLLREYHALLAKLTGLRGPYLRVPPAAAQMLAVVGNVGYRLCGIKTYVNAGDVRLARHYWFYDYARARNELGLVCRSPEASLRDTLDWLEVRGLWTRTKIVAPAVN
jgi:dihydroflavonol-4-reductase